MLPLLGKPVTESWQLWIEFKETANMPWFKNLAVERLEDRSLLATITVTSLIDGKISDLAGDGFISLREAIEAANKNISVDGSPSGSANAIDQIEISASLRGTIELIAGSLTVSDSVSIIGSGADKLTLDANQSSRIFEIHNVSLDIDVFISGLTMMGGKAAKAFPGNRGGAIDSSESLTLRDCIVTGNSSSFEGGAIFNSGKLKIISSTIIGNTVDFRGGGIANDGTLEMVNSTLASNQSLSGRPSGVAPGFVAKTSLLGVQDNVVTITKTSSVSMRQLATEDKLCPTHLALSPYRRGYLEQPSGQLAMIFLSRMLRLTSLLRILTPEKRVSS